MNFFKKHFGLYNSQDDENEGNYIATTQNDKIMPLAEAKLLALFS